MCNLYSMTKSVDAIRRLFAALNNRVGNLPSMPGIFPDYPVPIIPNAPDGPEIVTARWGMPSSQRTRTSTRVCVFMVATDSLCGRMVGTSTRKVSIVVIIFSAYSAVGRNTIIPLQSPVQD